MSAASPNPAVPSDAQTPAPRILAAGDSALVVEFGDTIDPALNKRVIALDSALRASALTGIIETVPTYRSLMVCYDPEVIRGAALAGVLSTLAGTVWATTQAHRLWHVPVLYGGAAGLDFAELAATKGLTPDALIALHGSVNYRVYMTGFAPGFTYLGGVPCALHTPRLTTPRQMTPAGGIAIGGAQACISALPGPSGWRFLGRTPLRSFDPARAKAFVFRAGDMVRFFPVSATDADALDAQAAQGEICARYEQIG